MIIDVSHHNGIIEWSKAGKHIEYAILRCGYGTNTTQHDDKQFNYNATQCEKYGIPYGVYLYSYATSIHQCNSEIDHILRCVKNRKIVLPLYYDIEENTTFANGQPKTFAQLFLYRIRQAGYKAGLYSNDVNYRGYFNELNPDSAWVARYSGTPPKSNYNIWQYTSKGTIPGIKGKVDISITDFPIGYMESYYTSIVDSVLANEYGTGIHRKNALYSEGINYWYIQNLVNKRLRRG